MKLRAHTFNLRLTAVSLEIFLNSVVSVTWPVYTV